MKGKYAMIYKSQNDREFYSLIETIIHNEEFQKMKKISHHGITRYEHLLRVSFYSYKITKFLRLNYQEATRASLLHDFFLEETKNDNQVNALRRHPSYALSNASKYFELTDREQDIIKTHMFPVTFTPPKYLESWVVDFVDDVAGIYEKSYSIRKELSAATTFLMMIFLNYLRFK